MNRMSPLDASFLHLEDANNHMHVSTVFVFEGPPPPFSELVAGIEARLPLVPRYRQKVRFVPLELGRPVWVNDPDFNLGYHLRRTALPAPGGEPELLSLTARLMAQQLDRHKPLWETWIVEGLENDRWAMIAKTHHCMVDGVAGAEMMSVVLDLERDPVRPEVSDDWRPTPEPSARSLLTRTATERLVSPYEGFRTVWAAARAPRRLIHAAPDVGRGLLSMRGLVRPTPPSSLSTQIGPHRRLAWGRVDLAAVKTVRAGLGGTVNDVLLAAVTNGYRALLLSRGEAVEKVVVRTMVPVSVRRPGEEGTYNNRVSGMYAELPVAIDDPVERLSAVREQMEGLKESHQAVAGEVLTSMSGFAPSMLLALATRLSARVPQRNVTTVVTNVPGPQIPLYTAGRKMLECFPCMVLAGTMSVGVSIFSYDGKVFVNVTGDLDRAPDVDVLRDGIEVGIQELVAAAKPDRGERSRSVAPATAGKRTRPQRQTSGRRKQGAS